MVEKKLFLTSQGLNVIYPNKENVFMVPNRKKMEMLTSIHVCHNWQNNIIPKIVWKEKLFSSSQSTNVTYRNEKNFSYGT